ncbi:hypothetical protein GCM10027575_77500 [Phytohabitans suffuscus]
MGGRAPGPLRMADTFWERDDVGHALRKRDFGTLFRLVAKYAGASQTQIAIAVGMTQGQVSTIVGGGRQVTALDVAERALDGLGAPDSARLAFGLAPKQAPESPTPSAVVPQPRVGATSPVDSQAAGAARSAQPVGANDVQLRLQVDGRELVLPLNRRALLHGGLAALLEAFALDGLADTVLDVTRHPGLTDRVTVRSTAHLGEVLARLREQWHALVKTDNLLGPRFALAGVRNQLSVLQGLLWTTDDVQRVGVVQLGAQYAESAAWLYEDSGDLGRARQWTLQAMEWAYEADDQKMLAWTGYRRSQQATAGGTAAEVIGLARAARRDEERLSSPTRAAIRVQEAYGRALASDQVEAQRLLDEAHQWAADDSDGDARGGHGSFCTESYIEINRANCWLTLGHADKALGIYDSAVRTLPSVYQRDRAAALAWMARAYVQTGQPEAAAATARAALPVARDAGSQRIVSQIGQVGARLEPQKGLAPVAALLADLDQEAA